MPVSNNIEKMKEKLSIFLERIVMILLKGQMHKIWNDCVSIPRHQVTPF